MTFTKSQIKQTHDALEQDIDDAVTGSSNHFDALNAFEEFCELFPVAV